MNVLGRPRRRRPVSSEEHLFPKFPPPPHFWALPVALGQGPQPAQGSRTSFLPDAWLRLPAFVWLDFGEFCTGRGTDPLCMVAFHALLGQGTARATPRTARHIISLSFPSLGSTCSWGLEL